MIENIEVVALIAGFLVTNAVIVVAIARFWSLPDRVDELEKNMAKASERLANMEGSMTVLIDRLPSTEERAVAAWNKAVQVAAWNEAAQVASWEDAPQA